MYVQIYMSGKSIHKIMEAIYMLLQQHKEISIRQLSIRINSQWLTVEKALNSMKFLKVVKERKSNEDNRKTRLFSLNK